jgi:hypothetical protein
MTDNTMHLTSAIASKNSLNREDDILSREFNVDIELGKRKSD